MQVQGYDIDVVVQAIPARPVCHGGLGWSTIVLLRGHGQVALIDIGSFNIRVPLVEQLKQRGLTPEDVTDLLLTHAHYDHIHQLDDVQPRPHRDRRAGDGLGLEGALGHRAGAGASRREVAELENAPRRRRRRRGDARHHRPHHAGPHARHFIYLLKGNDHDVLFTGDAAKNRAELLSGKTDMTYDQAVSSRRLRQFGRSGRPVRAMSSSPDMIYRWS